MRIQLGRLLKDGQQHFVARVEKIKNKYGTLVLLLVKITCNDKVVADHVWVTYDKAFEKVHIGNTIEFDAEVGVYRKGYEGTCQQLQKLKPIKNDYKLMNLSNVKKIIQKKGKENEKVCS